MPGSTSWVLLALLGGCLLSTCDARLMQMQSLADAVAPSGVALAAPPSSSPSSSPVVAALAEEAASEASSDDDSVQITSVEEPYIVSTRGDLLIKVYGNNFPANAVVKVGETDCLATRWSSATMMRCNVAGGVGEALPVSVVTDAETKSMPGAFSYQAPYVTSISPPRTPLNGDRLVHVFGGNFGTSDSSPIIRIGATACTTTRWISDSQIECVTPEASKEGPTSITAIVAGQIITNPNVFKIAEPYISPPFNLSDAYEILRQLNLTVEGLAAAANCSGQLIAEYLGDVVDPNLQIATLEALHLDAADQSAILIAHAVVEDRRDHVERVDKKEEKEAKEAEEPEVVQDVADLIHLSERDLRHVQADPTTKLLVMLFGLFCTCLILWMLCNRRDPRVYLPIREYAPPPKFGFVVKKSIDLSQFPINNHAPTFQPGRIVYV